jgi:pilus assembly protein CpaB
MARALGPGDVIFRRALLGLGAVAFVTGITLAVVWLKAPAATVVAEKPVAPPQAVLSAARNLRAGTLLRADDLRWVELPTTGAPPDSFVRGQATETDVLGAATRREFHLDEALVADQLIKPTDPGFLPAVLAPGMRATSIAVDVAEGGAGLLTPGDRVDVILTQTFTDARLSESQRSVSETILPNLRIIAIDQTTHVPGMARPGAIQAPVTAEPRLPKTVTLEVSVHQAEMLTVAGQLGKLQLTLRSLADATERASSGPEAPTWASEVSPALRSLAQGPAGSTPSPLSGKARALAAPLEVEIIRGSKGESVCYAPGGSSTNCGGTSGTAEPGPPAAKPGEPHLAMPRS